LSARKRISISSFQENFCGDSDIQSGISAVEAPLPCRKVKIQLVQKFQKSCDVIPNLLSRVFWQLQSVRASLAACAGVAQEQQISTLQKRSILCWPTMGYPSFVYRKLNQRLAASAGLLSVPIETYVCW
jgi:hypothetical protein